jgi:hypothetical protein
MAAGESPWRVQRVQPPLAVARPGTARAHAVQKNGDERLASQVLPHARLCRVLLGDLQRIRLPKYHLK